MAHLEHVPNSPVQPNMRLLNFPLIMTSIPLMNVERCRRIRRSSVESFRDAERRASNISASQRDRTIQNTSRRANVVQSQTETWSILMSGDMRMRFLLRYPKKEHVLKLSSGKMLNASSEVTPVCREDMNDAHSSPK